ncbi:MAG: hypothetical protein KC478_10410, partial [Bacteriovoracaceae bacterium]|nr:hypothetical protein [Bacteriovoracaceae bacterium]
NPKVHGQIDDINLLIQMVKEGDTVSIVPKESVEAELMEGKLIKIGDIGSINLNRWAIMSQHSQKKPYVRELINDFLNELNPAPQIENAMAF